MNTRTGAHPVLSHFLIQFQENTLSKVNLGLSSDSKGLSVNIQRDSEPQVVAQMPVPNAVQFFHDLWKHLGNFYPKELPDGDGLSHPHMMILGNASVAVDSNSSGHAELWLRPEQCAGIKIELKPDEARQLASDLHRAADEIDAFQNPN